MTTVEAPRGDGLPAAWLDEAEVSSRTDLIRPVQPGALISTGPFELSFTEATAQQLLDTNGVVTEWEIVLIGQARTNEGV